MNPTRERLKAVAVALGASALISACGGSSHGVSSVKAQAPPQPSVRVLTGWLRLPDERDTDHNDPRYRVVELNGMCFVETDAAYSHTQLTLAEYAFGSTGNIASVCDGVDNP